MTRNFGNREVLGANIKPPNERGFRRIGTDNLAPLQYDRRYNIVPIPSIWAAGYAFQQDIESGDPAAIEEWASLMLLYYFGLIHLKRYDRATIQQTAGDYLWQALSGTYPTAEQNNGHFGTGQLREIDLLLTESGAVVGAFYEPILFFPNRGRDDWAQHESVSQFLVDNRLSWQKCTTVFAGNVSAQRNLHIYLSKVARNLSPILRGKLEEFCRQAFGTHLETAETMPRHPRDHSIYYNEEPTQASFLRDYPLQKKISEDSTTYYLVDDLPSEMLSGWMTRPVALGKPSPRSYVQTGNQQITVTFKGEPIVCPLRTNDKIVRLSSLFVVKSPAWIKVPRDSREFTAHVALREGISLRDPALGENETSICLIPINQKFLEHFPDILKDERTDNQSSRRRNLDKITALTRENGELEWQIPIVDDNSNLNKQITWRSRPSLAEGVVNSVAMIYPPKVSPQWKMYALYGIGSKKTCGRWHLVDENGEKGAITDLETDEYVSILHSVGAKPNRPRALMLTDANDDERGILFINLAQLPEADSVQDKTVSLAVDFGTSNTCLAIKEGEDSSILRFALSPLKLWGAQETVARTEEPGFVPIKWGASDKGFFPTVLLSRKSDSHLPNVRPSELGLEHLFKVDVAGLHSEMVKNFESFEPDWDIHSNLKWDFDGRRPWRALFLELVLLYTHAEVFFNKRAKINNYTFTYPLAFSEKYGDAYHDEVKLALRRIRHYCYGTNLEAENFTYGKVDESRAVSYYVRQRGIRGTLEVFVDVGGGSADIAIRHEEQYLVLDSIRVAGKAFFNFAQKNLPSEAPIGSKTFRKHLGRLLQGDSDELYQQVRLLEILGLGGYYGIAINELTDAEFRKREGGILQVTMGDSKAQPSYQQYRSWLFFKHILAYSLIQACAAVVKYNMTLPGGLSLILGGNGWGLLMFAEWRRSNGDLQKEANDLLKLVVEYLEKDLPPEKKKLLNDLNVTSVVLLNEVKLSSAKNSVALGALNAHYNSSARSQNSQNGSSEETEIEQETTPFAGVTIPDLSINRAKPTTLNWYDRWSRRTLREKFSEINPAQIDSIKFNLAPEHGRPLNEVLKVFTVCGNVIDGKTDNMPKWQNINGELIGCIKQTDLVGDKMVCIINDEEYSAVPLNYFLSNILYNPDSGQFDFLDELAKANRRW